MGDSMGKKQITWILIAIAVIAAFMRLWALGEGDPMGDEVLYAFRAIGMVDFDEANEQTTPLEWFDPLVQSSSRVPEAYAIGSNIPWWTSLSFHDHPPLVFFIQYLFMQAFGEHAFVFRLPSALLGVVSVYLLFLIGKLLFSPHIGLLAAALGAVNVHLLFISRLGLQEAYVVFFLLLASYLFLRAQERDTFFLWTGAALGFAFLTKYTTFILMPIFFVSLLLFKRGAFFNKKFWFGILIALFIFSPVVFYNIQLYRAVGHFDFQFSHVFGQNPDVWQVAPGKEIGALADRTKAFIPALFDANSAAFLVVAAMGAIVLVHGLWRTTANFIVRFYVPLATLFLTIFIIVVIGPSARFLSMLTPFFVLSAAVFFDWTERTYQIHRTYLLVGFAAFIFFEIAYSANSLLLPYPKGLEHWAFSPLRYENFRWGYNELGAYLQKELEGKMPALHFDMQYQFLNELHAAAIEKSKQKNARPYSALILYDGNIDSIPQLWILDRLNLYHAWPVIKIETFVRLLQEQGEDYFKQIGFEHIYVIIPTDHVPWKDDKYLTSYGSEREQKLVAQGIEPVIIQNQRGEPAFRVYRSY